MQGTRRQQWAGPGARGGALAAGARVSPGKSGAEGGRDQAPNANAGAAHLPGQDRLLAQRAGASGLPPLKAGRWRRPQRATREGRGTRRVLLAWPLWPASPAHPPLSPFRACNPGPELGTRNKRQAWRWEALLRLQAGPWVSSLEGHLHSRKTSPEPAVE